MHVMWSQPWFFVIACLHFGQGLVWPPARSLRIISLNFSSACAFSIDLRGRGTVSPTRHRRAGVRDAGRHHLSYFSWCAFRAASCCITYAQLPSCAGPTCGIRTVASMASMWTPSLCLPAHERAAKAEGPVALLADVERS